MNKKPNFFIVGAPRCGTTSMAFYLQEHPQIFFPKIKEPKFFCSDLLHRRVKDIDEYEELFAGATNKHIRIGEASTSYAYSKTAISNIKEYSPKAKLIFMVRNPLKLVQSLHREQYFRGVESISDFKQAWHAQQKRKRGQKIPATCNDFNRLMYGDIASMGEQLSRMLEIFTSDKILVVFLEDFIRGPDNVYKQVLNHLELKNNNRKEFPIINKSREYSNHHAKKMMNKIEVSIKKYFNYKISKNYLWRIIKNLNSTTNNQVKHEPFVKKKLIEYFENDIDLLSKLTNRNLEHWKKLEDD